MFSALLYKEIFVDILYTAAEYTAVMESVSFCNRFASSFEIIVYSFEVLQISDKIFILQKK
jgi:hypothetical protein